MIVFFSYFFFMYWVPAIYRCNNISAFGERLNYWHGISQLYPLNILVLPSPCSSSNNSHLLGLGSPKVIWTIKALLIVTYLVEMFYFLVRYTCAQYIILSWLLKQKYYTSVYIDLISLPAPHFCSPEGKHFNGNDSHLCWQLQPKIIWSLLDT